MKPLRSALLSLLMVGCLTIVGCGGGGGGDQAGGNASAENSSEDGKYRILDTRTDQFDRGRAKELVQDSIAKYPNLDCMVGLFAYNPPIMLDVVKEAGMLDSIALIGFDENFTTLQAIVDGEIYGTVVQNPYGYGYESVRILAALAKDDKSVLPESGYLDLPPRKITKENVKEFWDNLKDALAKAEEITKSNTKKEGKPTVAFVTNGIDPFWDIAAAGALMAGNEFDVNVEVIMPPEGAADQKRMVEDLLTKGVDGVAISPIDPENQSEFLNQIAEKTNLITHDSDAPKSNRLCYIGTDNVRAGRMCGELAMEARPDGANIMIYVGRLEQLNAQQRRQGVIDAVTGKPEESNTDGDSKESDAAAKQEDDGE